jgi:hypothetical protein
MAASVSELPDLDRSFPRYTDFDPQVPVWCVTPGRGAAIHRFFDTSPISPSGRYLAVLRLPFEDRRPAPGDAAEVCLIDLASGDDRVVAQTHGWEPQLGANINWGADDHSLIFNDVDLQTWQPFAWRLDPLTGQRQRLGGTVYHVSPDGRWACATNPVTMPRTQYGYGVIVPADRVPRYQGPRDDNGLWLTDTQTGARRLLLSIKDAMARATPAFEIDGDPNDWEIYPFHSKFSPTADRLIFTLRFFPSDGTSRWNTITAPDLRFTVLTLDLEAKEICNAVPTSKWLLGGHHINFFPDGRRLSMNLGWKGEPGLWFTACNVDGANLHRIRTDLPGSGHPSVHPDGRHILTDTYTFEGKVSYGDGTIPLRWVDVRSGSVQNLVRINTKQPWPDAALRVDAHPAWDRSWRYVTFNAFVGGTRRVYIADMRGPLGGWPRRGHA